MHFNFLVVLRYVLNFAASAYFTELASNNSIAQRRLYPRVSKLRLVSGDLEAYQGLVAFVKFLSAHFVAQYLGRDSMFGQAWSQNLSDGIERWESL